MRVRVGVLVMLLLAAACGREGQGPPSPSPADQAEVTSAPEATEPPAEPDPTEDASPSPAARATAAVARSGCRNSTDAACGELRFDPDPNDEQIRVAITYFPRDPNVGDEVKFDLRGTDPDSRFVYLGTYRYGEDEPSKIVKDPLDDCPRAYGAWDPPDEKSGAATKTLRHVYRKAGTYRALFTFFSHSYTKGNHPWPNRPPGDEQGSCIDPLGSSGRITVTIRVSE